MSKVFLFGIDGAPPELLFDQWLDDLPTIKQLINKGAHARLRSTTPPTTIIAWNAMFSGKDPSELGVFSYTYKTAEGKTQLVNSKNLREKRLWNIISENKKTISLYVPLTYPVEEINGMMVSGFLTPSIERECAYPEAMKERIKKLKNPELFFDVAVGVASHKSLELGTLIKNTYEMTGQQITLIKELLKEEWDLFLSVMIGSDRLQHMIWRHFDETHRRYIKNSPHKNALKEYYQYLDKELGECIKLLPPDTTIIVASDHGFVKQEGKINLNNWLIEQGYLHLKPGTVVLGEKKRLKMEMIDWEESVAYGGGAYNGRVFLNKETIERKGVQREALEKELIKKIKEIPDDKGRPLKTTIYRAEDIYVKPGQAECPDLTIYFDELRWASNPDLGQEGLYSWTTAVGADSAGHGTTGILIMAGEQIPAASDLGEIDIRQVCPTILHLLGEQIPKDIKISPIEFQKKSGERR